jgi:hypothetical protein
VIRIRLFLLFLFPAFLAAQGANLPAYLGSTMSAPTLTTGEKFDFRITQSFGFRGVAGAAFGGLVGQATNTPSEWGQGVSGYATRFASGFGSNLARQSMAFALETALHEDSRYFPSTEKDFKSRIKNVLLQSVVTRTDSGGGRFAYSRIASAFGAGQLVNTWSPNSNSTVQDGLVRGLITLGGDAGFNFLREFVPFLRPKSLKR